jgi:hypothetical protein
MQNPLADPEWGRKFVVNWTRTVPRSRDVTIVGMCPHCGELRQRSDPVQVEVDECCCYACRQCGTVLDEGQVA